MREARAHGIVRLKREDVGLILQPSHRRAENDTAQILLEFRAVPVGKTRRTGAMATEKARPLHLYSLQRRKINPPVLFCRIPCWRTTAGRRAPAFRARLLCYPTRPRRWKHQPKPLSTALQWSAGIRPAPLAECDAPATGHPSGHW